MLFKFNRRHLQSGFTLLEMVVVVAIVLIITTVVLSYVPQFRDRSGLDLVAQEIAVNVRGAQVFASGGKSSSGLYFPDDKPSYGIYFNKINGSFSLFANLNDGMTYFDEGDVIQETRELSGLVFDSLMADGIETDELAVTYTRPSLQASICRKTDGDNWVCGNNEAEVRIKAPRTDKRKAVIVHFNGQIGVENVN